MRNPNLPLIDKNSLVYSFKHDMKVVGEKYLWLQKIFVCVHARRAAKLQLVRQKLATKKKYDQPKLTYLCHQFLNSILKYLLHQNFLKKWRNYVKFGWSFIFLVATFWRTSCTYYLRKNKSLAYDRERVPAWGSSPGNLKCSVMQWVFSSARCYELPSTYHVPRRYDRISDENKYVVGTRFLQSPIVFLRQQSTTQHTTPCSW
jgi:hypothetical protein